MNYLNRKTDRRNKQFFVLCVRALTKTITSRVYIYSSICLCLVHIM